MDGWVGGFRGCVVDSVDVSHQQCPPGMHVCMYVCMYARDIARVTHAQDMTGHGVMRSVPPLPAVVTPTMGWFHLCVVLPNPTRRGELAAAHVAFKKNFFCFSHAMNGGAWRRARGEGAVKVR